MTAGVNVKPANAPANEAGENVGTFSAIRAGGEIAWPKPTRPGDILRVESEILEIVPSRSKPSQAVVIVRSTTLNQKGEHLQAFTAKIVVFKRPGDPNNKA